MTDKPTDKASDKRRYTTPAVEKAFTVLELISHHPDGLRMIDVTEQLSLPKTSAYVLLRCLEHLGYLAIDERSRYRLTLKLFELGMRAQEQVGLVALAGPHLDRLVESTGLTGHLALLEREEVVYVAKVDSPGFVKFETHVGKHAPAQLTAVGKAILAYLPSAELDEILPRLDLRRGTANASHSARELRRALEAVRSTGYAVEDEEAVEGVRCVAAPVLRSPGKGAERAPEKVIASVGVIGLKATLSDDRITMIGALVTQAAQAIAAEVGPGTPQN